MVPIKRAAAFILFWDFRFIYLWGRYEIIIIIVVITLSQWMPAWLGLLTFRDRLREYWMLSDEQFIWPRGSAEGKNGTMARNDITIPLISCKFETSTVLILQTVFTIETSKIWKGNIRSVTKCTNVWAFVAAYKHHLLLCTWKPWHFLNLPRVRQLYSL